MKRKIKDAKIVGQTLENNNRGKDRNIFSEAVKIGIIIATIFSVLLSFCKIFILNESQLLYLFSVMAQVVGGTFGLTLTAYIFFVGKLREIAEDDDIYYDAINSLLNNYFCDLFLIAITCGIAIIFCVIGIITLNNWISIFPLIINTSVLFSLIGILAILSFGIMLLNPRKIDNEIEKLKKSADAFYNIESDNSGDFGEFLRTYNMLESLIITFAEKFLNTNNYNYTNYKPRIIQSLKVLAKNQIINGELLSEINELRMYRNALVHGVDFSVSQNVCERILEIYSRLNKTYEVFCNYGIKSSEWDSMIKEQYNFR